MSFTSHGQIVSSANRLEVIVPEMERLVPMIQVVGPLVRASLWEMANIIAIMVLRLNAAVTERVFALPERLLPALARHMCRELAAVT